MHDVRCLKMKNRRNLSVEKKSSIRDAKMFFFIYFC